MILYTSVGGVQAVAWTDVKQMVIVVSGMVAAVVVLLLGIPHGVTIGQALHVAGAAGRVNPIDFRFDWSQTYTFWSGLLGGLFLMLSYFGCDQSQVQRYLTAKSVDEGRQSLMMSAYWKIPLQALVLLTGVLLFAFYTFNQPPLLFNPEYKDRIQDSARAAEYQGLEAEFGRAFAARREAARLVASATDADRDAAKAAFAASGAAVKDVRLRAARLVQEVTGDDKYKAVTGDTPSADVNYVFPTFITTRMPIGLVGLMIAAIFAAAMSSIAAELNSLATATVIDLYRRLIKPDGSDAHFLRVSKLATLGWGLVACAVASVAVGLGSLIEVVNRFGSIFYGSLLGVFVLALAYKRATANGAFIGLLAGISTGLVFAFHPATRGVSFLWHNPLGVIVVVVVGIAVSMIERPAAAS
jgi:Na+/proline symporter